MAKIQCNVISYVLKRTVDITVILPTVTIPEAIHPMQDKEYKPTHKYPEKFPVLYLLHGFGNNHAQWSGYTGIELFAEERQIAVVMFSGENKSYVTNPYDDFEAFIQDELPEFITNTFPISTRVEDTYIAGLSMGGFGSLYHAFKHPEKYQAVGAFSPGVSMREGRDNLFEVVKDVKKCPPIYLVCGDKDFLFEDNIKFDQALTEQGLEHEWIIAPNYAHEWRFWNEYVEKFLDWIPRTDYYSKLGKRTV